MGRFYKEITVSKGLPPDLRHLKGRLRKRKGLRRRTIDESSVVEVEEWPVRHTADYCALSYFVSSCNVCGGNLCTEYERWDNAVIEHVDRRLKEHSGFAKGRVLYLIGEDFFGKRTTVGVLLFHIPRAGTVQILRAATARDIYPERHELFVAALLLCAARVARERGDGKSATLSWLVTAHGRARQICKDLRVHRGDA